MSVDLHSLHLAVRLRRLLARHRWIRWSVVIACAITVASGLHTKLSDLDRAQAAWAGGEPILVLRHDTAAGDAIAASDVERRYIAPDLRPDGALASWDDPMTALHRMRRGEILTNAHIGRGIGPAGLLSATTAGVSVPIVAAQAVPFAVGDRVGLVLAADPLAVGVSPANGWLGEASVIAATPEAVLVSVASDGVVEIAVAAAEGQVTLVLLSSASGPVRSAP
jgi:hypothetical protein